MTAPTGRVYPVKVTQRDLALHRRSVDALTTTTPPESLRAVVTDLRHRIACAERWEETRTKRLTDYEKWITTTGLRRTLIDAMNDGRDFDAAALARSLVRITRDPA